MLTKKELISLIGDKCDMPNAQVERVMDGFTTVVTSQLMQGNDVSLSGIGRLKLKIRAARQGRNPMNGAAVQIAEKTTVSFAPAKGLKDALNAA